jgi:hypothetical protein
MILGCLKDFELFREQSELQAQFNQLVFGNEVKAFKVFPKKLGIGKIPILGTDLTFEYICDCKIPGCEFRAF